MIEEKLSKETEEFIDKLIKEKEQYHNRLQYALAELDNVKKRSAVEKPGLIEQGEAKVLKEMFEVTDDFERALSNNHSIDDPDALREGFELIYNKFMAAFRKLDVVQIWPQPGVDKFDITEQEAVATVPTSDPFKNGYICDVLRAGYKLGDKVIRHAQVAVYKN